jgi:hypothetical protein
VVRSDSLGGCSDIRDSAKLPLAVRLKGELPGNYYVRIGRSNGVIR